MFSQTWYHSSCSKAKQTTQSDENTNDDINIKQSTSYLVSNGTGNKNDNMVTTDRNVKEYTSSVESIFQKKMAGPPGGISPCNQINSMIMFVYCNLCLVKHDIIPLV